MMKKRGVCGRHEWIIITSKNINRVMNTSVSEVQSEFMTSASHTLHSHYSCSVK